MQNSDQKFYVALSYVGVNAMRFDQLTVESLAKSAKEEEEFKSSLDVKDKTTELKKCIQALIIKSNLPEDQVQDHDLKDISILEEIIESSDLSVFDELKDMPRGTDASKFLFNRIELVRQNFDQLIEREVINENRIEDLYLYCFKEFGISGEATTSIFIKFLNYLSKEKG